MRRDRFLETMISWRVSEKQYCYNDRRNCFGKMFKWKGNFRNNSTKVYFKTNYRLEVKRKSRARIHFSPRKRYIIIWQFCSLTHSFGYSVFKFVCHKIWFLEFPKKFKFNDLLLIFKRKLKFAHQMVLLNQRTNDQLVRSTVLI